NLVDFNGTLYFAANDGVHGGELWKSDGTAAGTVLVADINRGSDSSFPLSLSAVNGQLFFSATGSLAEGEELWVSDGTAKGTQLVKDILPGPADSVPFDFHSFNGSLYFTADNGTGPGLWRSDGTAAGTVLLKGGSYPFSLTNVNGRLFFSVFDTEHGV